jgi:hypothetical protein
MRKTRREISMFKNISFADLWKAKRWWGAITTAAPLLLASWAEYQATHNLGKFLYEVIPVIGGLLVTVGWIDNTGVNSSATPTN